MDQAKISGNFRASYNRHEVAAASVTRSVTGHHNPPVTERLLCAWCHSEHLIQAHPFCPPHRAAWQEAFQGWAAFLVLPSIYKEPGEWLWLDPGLSSPSPCGHPPREGSPRDRLGWFHSPSPLPGAPCPSGRVPVGHAIGTVPVRGPREGCIHPGSTPTSHGGAGR